jgi:gluconate 2-dehydrogenase gamma chain
MSRVLNDGRHKMAVDQKQARARRIFLIQAASLTGAGSLVSAVVPAEPTAATAAPIPEPDTTSPLPYQSLSPDEATFIEALVNVMCPADEYSPSGIDCGLATYIDRQLAGPYGKGDGRYQRGPFRSGKPQLGLQLPLTPEQFCKAGIAAVNALCIREHGIPFDRLTPSAADALLQAIEGDHVQDDGLSLALWFNEVLYPLFIEACFADPMYGGNRRAVFWKMIGYPGLPATYTLDMVRYRGTPYPGARDPKSIADFT